MGADFFCPHCGAANPSGNTVCSVCAYAFTPASPARTGLLQSQTLLKQRYQVVTTLGQGGFAAVYQAKDLQFSSALRAIKEMDAHQLAPQEKHQAITAFKQEAHLLARLMHPNLPRIYDHFEEQQRWYLVMDYIDGETLSQVLARSPQGKLPVQKVIAYALQLCTVLQHLHTQLPPIIFRDLKPANIMVTPADHLYLIDFGIARFFKPGQVKDTIALGSVGYAPPEQFGKAQTTAQADIYSLGATLHHLLSGRDPGDEPFVFLPLHLQPHNAKMKALADLITRMLALKKEERPADVLEIQQALTALQQTRRSRRAKPPVPAYPYINNPPGSLVWCRRVRSRASPLTMVNGQAQPSVPAYPHVNDPVGDMLWPRDVDSRASPLTVVNGVIYSGSMDGKLYALDAASGEQKWSFHIGYGVDASPTVVNGIIYFGSLGGKFYALDASSGRKLWFFHTDYAVRSHTVVNSIVYFRINRSFYAINATSGRKIWSSDEKLNYLYKGVIPSPMIDNGVIYLNSVNYEFNSNPSGNSICALDASSGQKLWSFPTGGKVPSPPIVVDGMVYFDSMNDKLYALDASSGQELWSFYSDRFQRPLLIVQSGVVYFGPIDDKLYALDASSGRQKWSFHIGYVVPSPPTVVDDMVYLGSHDGKLYALDASSGQQKWSFRSDSRINSSPTVVDSMVYFCSVDHKLYALDASSGQQKWSFPFLGPIKSSLIVQSGIIYFEAGDNMLYAIFA